MDSLPINSIENTNRNTAPSTKSFAFNQKLNSEFLEQSYSQNLEFGHKMFSIFLRTINEDINTLNNALKANDYSGIKDIAHKIKNNFTWVGLPRLSSLMYKVEKAAADKSVTVVEHHKELMSNFKKEHQLVKEEYDRINEFLGL